MKAKKSYFRSLNGVFLVAAVFWLFGPGSAVASDQIPAKPQDHPIALVGATIHTVSGETIARGTVLFIDGKITALGTNVPLPDGTEKIDVSGKHIYPGLISANSRLGLLEIGAVRATRDFAEVGDIKPNVRAQVSINPDSELLPVARANGLTLVHTIPLGGLISGTSALIRLDGWTWEEMTYVAPVGLYVDWPFMGVRHVPWVTKTDKEQLKERDEKIAKIKNAFAEARAYLKAKEAEAVKGVPYHATDVRWEAMIPFLKKEKPVLLHARGLRQIEAALDWATSEDLKIILVANQDAARVADRLHDLDIPVIYEGTLTTPRRRWEPYDMPFAAPKKLYDAGVKFCISGSGGTFEAAHERNLPYHAAMAAAFGLPKEEALKAVTLYPAQILGVADRVGSLEVGKDATLIVTDGDPLEIRTHVEQEFIEGRKIDLSSRHTQLYEKYRIKYERLRSTDGKEGVTSR